MKNPTRLGDLQLAILDILWQHGESTVAEVHQALLDTRGLALTTIATMLRKMESRKLVEHRTEGRQFVYRPCHSRSEIHRSIVGDLIDRLFQGDASELVSHLIREREIDEDELARLNDLIRSKEPERGRRDGQ